VSDVLNEDASDFQTISTCQDGPACREHVHNKSCVSCSWNSANDARDILATSYAISYEDVGRVREDAARKLPSWNRGFSVQNVVVYRARAFRVLVKLEKFFRAASGWLRVAALRIRCERIAVSA